METKAFVMGLELWMLSPPTEEIQLGALPHMLCGAFSELGSLFRSPKS